MSQAAIEEVVVANEAAERAPKARAASPAAPTAQGMLESMQAAWKRNLQASAEAAQAFQQQNAEFASRLLDLNLRAARDLSQSQPAGERLAKPFELGASALELYLGYLGKSAALAQQAIVLPWTRN